MAKRLIGVCGPTASGKTAVAVELCRRIGGEVVSADSMQVYRGMDILSAAPDEREMGGVPHHMIRVLPPNARFNASRYREMASAEIEEIEARGKVPVLCGGTGLYINALTKGMRLSERADEALRAELKAIAAEDGGEERLHGMLAEVDPESAARYPAGDVRRVIRSIEIYRLTGMTRRRQEEIDARTPNAFDAKLFVRSCQRQELCGIMQFSASPWRVPDAADQRIVRETVVLRQRLAPRFVGLATACATAARPAQMRPDAARGAPCSERQHPNILFLPPTKERILV